MRGAIMKELSIFEIRRIEGGDGPTDLTAARIDPPPPPLSLTAATGDSEPLLVGLVLMF
jgi:hypothetical protein